MFLKLSLLCCIVLFGVAFGQFNPNRPIPKALFRQPQLQKENLQAKIQIPIEHEERYQQEHLERTAYNTQSHPDSYVPQIPKTPQVPQRVRVEDQDELDYQLEQAKNAQYSFGSDIKDDINDGAISHQETRDGLALKGRYSYSDGFFKRTVHYEADENGYRVVKEEIQPIGDGPKFNPHGKADVQSSLAGSYSITGDDIRDIRDRDYYEKNKQKKFQQE